MGAAENKAAVVAAYEAFGAGDVPSVIAMNAPDAVWTIHSAPNAPFAGEHKGTDAIGAFFGLIPENIEITEFAIAPIAAEGDTVVAVGHQTYTVKSTGKTASGPLVHVFTFGPDGKVSRFEEYEVGVDAAWS